MESTRQRLSGLTIGRFEVHELCGSGTSGQVYRAYDSKIRRDVAHKRLSSSDHVRKRRLQEEAVNLSSVTHSNVATVYDFLEIGGETFLAMEFVNGQTLRSSLNERNVGRP